MVKTYHQCEKCDSYFTNYELAVEHEQIPITGDGPKRIVKIRPNIEYIFYTKLKEPDTKHIIQYKPYLVIQKIIVDNKIDKGIKIPGDFYQIPAEVHYNLEELRNKRLEKKLTFEELENIKLFLSETNFKSLDLETI